MKKCALCSTELKFRNTPVFGNGKLKDGEEVCLSCFNKIGKAYKINPLDFKKYTLSEMQNMMQEQSNSSHCQENKNPASKQKVVLFLILGVIFLIVIIAIANSGKKDDSASNQEAVASGTVENHIGIGQVLKTKYFDVTVNSAQLRESVETGNPFAELPAEAGHCYIVLNTTFKNTDNESRTILDGKIMIDYNGKRYNFDKSETIMIEGWGLFLDQINPLTSKTTNLVYKIPSEIKGYIWYQPGRSSKNEVIFLGNIQ